MSYLVAVLSDKSKAEAAYYALQKQGVASDRINILGQGYQSADEYGFIDPIESVRKETTREISWIVPFGFVAGFVFNWLTGISIFDAIPAIGNHLIGGLFGAAAGVLGAYLNSTNVVGLINSDETLPSRNRLDAGKYLIIVKGPDSATNERATNVLNQFEPENIQGYNDPVDNN
jgi:hypothetical protein